MILKPLFFFILLTVFRPGIQAQGDRQLYLGPTMDSLYFRDTVHNVINGKIPFLSFLGYQTFQHVLLNENTSSFINRAGIILDAKSTTTVLDSMSAVFGTASDTSLIDYQVDVDRVRFGRSAANSLYNLTASSSDRIPQSDPVEDVEYVEIHGRIKADSLSSDFSFIGNHRKDAYYPSGWMILHGDTLKVTQVKEQKKKNGKIKHPYTIFKLGFILKRGDLALGAVDAYNNPAVIYVSKMLDRSERLLICSFLFTAAAY